MERLNFANHSFVEVCEDAEIYYNKMLKAEAELEKVRKEFSDLVNSISYTPGSDRDPIRAWVKEVLAGNIIVKGITKEDEKDN